MPYAARAPSAWLAPYVERVWSLSDVVAHGRERILPSGTFELVINLERDEIVVCADGEQLEHRHSGALVSGAYGRSFVIEARAHRSILGVHFRPGGAAAFLGMPALELADQHVDLDALWGRDAARLRDALCSAASTRERFDLVETALRRRLDPRRGRPLVRAAIDSLARSADGIGVLVRDSGLSHRRFVDVFAADVGMLPKRFARVCRFQRALDRARSTSAPWAEIALACGYADQSHLIRDFRDLAGLTPAEHTRLRSDALLANHVVAEGSLSSKTGRAPRH